MRLLFAFSSLLLLFTGVSCTVPQKYTALDYAGSKGGYLVAAESSNGAALEAYTVEYHFMPHAFLAAEKARRHFLKSAQAIAARKGKVASQAVIDEADITRNMVSGTYKTVLTGVVVFGKGAPAVKPVDNSMLEHLAEASVDKSRAVVAMSVAAAAAMAESNRESQRMHAINSLDSSIRSNTSALNNLRSELNSVR
jgi:hypothetical protein